jgi:hypothetical protein
MKSLLLIVCACLFSFSEINADWQDSWMNAIQYATQENFIDAENEIDIAISQIEKNKECRPEVYLDRAKIRLQFDQFKLAILDTDIAIASSSMTTADKISCYSTRQFAFAALDDLDGMIEARESLKEVFPYFPELEFTQDKLIIRNFENSESGRKMIRCAMAALDICSEKEVLFIGDYAIIYLDKQVKISDLETCGCGCGGGCASDVIPKGKCEEWCERGYQTVIFWCGCKFSGKCNAVCQGGAYIFLKMCQTCCSNEENACTRYFNNINNYMAKYGCWVD